MELRDCLLFLAETNPGFPFWCKERASWPDYSFIEASTRLDTVRCLILFSVGSIRFFGKSVEDTLTRMTKTPAFNLARSFGFDAEIRAYCFNSMQIARSFLGQISGDEMERTIIEIKNPDALELLQRHSCFVEGNIVGNNIN